MNSLAFPVYNILFKRKSLTIRYYNQDVSAGRSNVPLQVNGTAFDGSFTPCIWNVDDKKILNGP